MPKTTKPTTEKPAKRSPGGAKTNPVRERIEAETAAAADSGYVTRGELRDGLRALQDYPDDYLDLPLIESRCKICKHVAGDRELRLWLNRNLLAGTNHQVILDHLAASGLDVRAQALSPHYRRHVLPYIMDLIRHKATTSVFVEAAGRVGQQGSIAEIMVTSMLLKLQPIVEGLDPAEISQLAPDRQIDLLLRSTKALADIQSLEAQAKLRAIDLALKQASLSNAERKAMARATAAIRDILTGHPDLWAQLQPILAPLAEDTPALPEASGG